jgi:hypothetical protein
MTFRSSTTVLLVISCLLLSFISLSAANELNGQEILKNYQKIAKNSYQFDLFSNPHKFYEKVHFSELLGGTGLSSDSKIQCQNIQKKLNSLPTTTPSVETTSNLYYLSKLINFYSCTDLIFTQSQVDLIDILILSDSLYEINTGVTFYSTLVQLKYPPSQFGPSRHDWVDIIDLLTSLHLTDGLSRSTVSTLSPSFRNTLIIIDLLTKIVKFGPEHFSNTSINQYLTKTMTAINTLTQALCNNGSSSISTLEYADFFEFVSRFQKVTHITKPIPVTFQCVISAVQSTLNTTKFTAAYAATRFLNVVVEMKSAKNFIFTDLINQDEQNNRFFFLTTPTLFYLKPNEKELNLKFSLFEIIDKFEFKQIDNITPQFDLDLSLIPTQGANIQASSTTTKINKTDLISKNGVNIQIKPSNGSIYQIYTIKLTPVKYNMIIFSTQLNINAISNATKQVLTTTPSNYGQINLTIDAEKAKTKLAGVNTDVVIDLSTQRQFNIEMKTEKNNIYSLRLISCGVSQTKTKCQSNIQGLVNTIPTRYNTATSFFPLKNENKENNVAHLYFTAPDLKSVIISSSPTAQTPSNFILVLDVTDIINRQTQSTVISSVQIKISNQEMFEQFFPQPDPRSQQSYLWSVIKEHYHTFSSPKKIANPFITTVFLFILIAFIVIFSLAFLTLFRPSPNFTTALSFINFVIFTSGLGTALAALLLYWFKLKLLDALFPALLLVVPFIITMYLPLKESVSSLRLYNLLYTAQDETKEKKD